MTDCLALLRACSFRKCHMGHSLKKVSKYENPSLGILCRQIDRNHVHHRSLYIHLYMLDECTTMLVKSEILLSAKTQNGKNILPEAL